MSEREQAQKGKIMNLCDDNRIITIEKAKQELIKGTNIEDSPEEMKVLDNILFRCWQMGWLDRYDPQMPSNTSNALKALNSVNATQFNALDSISRQAAIETVMECYDNAELFEVYEEKLRELPPAQPESDSGRWERHYSRPGVYTDLYWHCSKCGYKTDYQYANVNHHYCPHCGRKMEREVSNE